MRDRPKILFVGGSAVPSGVAAFIKAVTEALGDDVESVVVSEPDQGGYGGLPKGVRHIAVDGLATTLNPFHQRRARDHLEQVILNEKPSLVWAHARMSVHLCRDLFSVTTPGFPRLAVSLHGLPFGPGHRPTLKAMSKRVELGHLRHAHPHHIHLLTQEDMQFYCAALPHPIVARHTFHTLGTVSHLGQEALSNGVTLARNRPLRIVMTTRDSYQKNLIEAARVLACVRIPWRLDLWGSGTQSKALSKKFRAVLGSRIDQVQFHGPTRDVATGLAEADMYLMTSRYEGMSIGVHEAFECGLALALSDIPANQVFLKAHPFAAALPLGNPSDAAQRLDQLYARLIQTPDHRQRSQTIWRSSFSPELWTEQARQMLRDIMDGPFS
ncbi:glycosyltransferase [Celeribacter baekdonensis]|uniref:glycosyltransferase n=1 Tax=Celeribacter baekdonensis TaxID=875171 RepID=UPI003A93CECD